MDIAGKSHFEFGLVVKSTYLMAKPYHDVHPFGNNLHARLVENCCKACSLWVVWLFAYN